MTRAICKRRENSHSLVGVGGEEDLAIIKGIWEEEILGSEKGQDAPGGFWNV